MNFSVASVVLNALVKPQPNVTVPNFSVASVVLNALVKPQPNVTVPKQ